MQIVDVLIGTISKVVHLHVQVERKVGILEEFDAILRHQRKIVKRIKLVDESWFWQLLCCIIDQPASHVRVESVGNGIEEVLRIVSMR